MYTTYTIGELVKILGVTAETIRYYERKNIIQPIHNEESGYRYYTAWDLHVLIRARCYLGFGLTIEETADLLKKENAHQIDEVLEKQEQVIEKNIIYQMNLLKKIRLNRKLLNDTKDQHFSILKSPGIYRIDTQKCYNIDLTKQEQNELNTFCQNVPFIFLTAHFKKEDIDNYNTDFYFGVGIEEEYASLFDIQETDYIQYYPPQNCLYMCISSHSGQFLTYHALNPAFEYMKQNNLQLNGDIITQIIAYSKPQDEYINWHHIWIPIK